MKFTFLKLFHITKIKKRRDLKRKWRKKSSQKKHFESSQWNRIQTQTKRRSRSGSSTIKKRMSYKRRGIEQFSWLAFILHQNETFNYTIFSYFIISCNLIAHPSCFGFLRHFTMLSRSLDLQHIHNNGIKCWYHERIIKGCHK